MDFYLRICQSPYFLTRVFLNMSICSFYLSEGCVYVCHGWRFLTYVAVFSGPSLVTLTLALLTQSVLGTQRVARLLVTHRPRPALFAATPLPKTHPSAPAVHRTHLCNTHTQLMKHCKPFTTSSFVCVCVLRITLGGCDPVW